ncbi:unnamed protein product [Orchesella dallaii]|uniref:Activity-regulated cytoskeleton-associated protein n=1 Tax=Orchesella dallaii TaxID=48710 RepID=A0ABP1QW82_9HEXA
MKTRKKRRLARVFTPLQKLSRVGRRPIAVDADTGNPISQISQVTSSHPSSVITAQSGATSVFSTPLGVLQKKSNQTSSVNMPTDLINMETVNTPRANLTSEEQEGERTSNNGFQNSGSSSNSIINARDGLQSFNAAAGHNVGVPENRTPITITKDAVLTNLQNEYIRVLQGARLGWIRSRRALLDAHKITVFDEDDAWNEEGNEAMNDALGSNALNEHQAYVENIRRNKREAIRDQNRNQYYNVAHFNTPNEVIDLRQPVSQRPNSLEIQVQSSQPLSNTYHGSQKRYSIGGNANQISSAASNDGDWRNSRGFQYNMQESSQSGRGNQAQHISNPPPNGFAPQATQGFLPSNIIHDFNNMALGSNYSGTSQQMPSGQHASSMPHRISHTQSQGSNANYYNYQQGTQARTPHYFQSTPVINQAHFGAGSTLDRHHLKSFDIPKYSGFGEKKTPYDFLAELERYMQISGINSEALLARVIPTALVDDAFFWYNMEMSWDPFEDWEQFKLRFRHQYQPVDYERQLKRELDDRYQGQDESLSFFLRIIAGYYYRLGIQNDSRIIEKVCEQMHPLYKRHIRDARLYQSLAHFKKAVEHADCCVQAEQKYKPPLPGNSIEPLLAYTPREAPIDLASNTGQNKITESIKKPFEGKKHVSFTQNYEKQTFAPNNDDNDSVNRSHNALNKTQTGNMNPVHIPRSRSPSPGRNFTGCFNCQGNHFARDCPNAKPSQRPQSPNPLNSKSLDPQTR